MSNNIIIIPGRGCVFNSPAPSVAGRVSGGGKRGSVSTFTSASRRRLREFLIFRDLPENYRMFGYSLTVPGPPLDLQEKTLLWKRFKDYLINHQVPCVWRLELQERGSVHWHLIVGLSGQILPAEIKAAWIHSLNSLGKVSWNSRNCLRADLPGAKRYICDFSVYDGGGKWLRYLADHQSKVNNQVADGFGRHWGIVNRSLWIPKPSVTVDLTLKQQACVNRWHERLRRGSGGSKRYVSHRGRLFHGTAVFFTETDTISKMLSLAVQLHPDE